MKGSVVISCMCKDAIRHRNHLNFYNDIMSLLELHTLYRQ